MLRIVALALWATAALSVSAQARPVASERPDQPRAETPDARAKRLAREVASSAAMEHAQSLVLTGDTTGAIAILRDAVQKDPKNGPLWYANAVLLSGRSKPGWRKGVMPGRIPSLVIAADSAFALAIALSPDSVRWAVEYGKFLWSNGAMNVGRASRVQFRASDKLDGSDDSTVVAESADQIGIMLWRRLEHTIRNVASPTGDDFAQMSDVEGRVSAGMLAFALKHRTPIGNGIDGGSYDEALRYFRTARTADPDNELAFRHEMMFLGTFERWEEMAEIGRRRASARPQQPWPWLALGLAEHRVGHTAVAQAAFDSGFARLRAADRERLESVAYLLPDSKVRWYKSLTGPARAAFHELYWNTANVSMLSPTNPRLSEFRARVVFAELRFTDDEKPMRGASSEKGEVFIRYGPPDYYFGPHSWLYARELMHFDFFQRYPYGTAYLTMASATDLEHYRFDWPSTWTNVAMFRNRIDSVTAQVARFRGAGDSVDLAIFTGIRTGALRRDAAIDSSVIRHGVFLTDALGRELARTTRQTTSAERDTTIMESHSYFLRGSPRATAVRIEALEPNLMQSARTISDISGFVTSGFAVSDLLVAANVEPMANRTVTRWSDYSIAALTGNLVATGSPLSLLWETYEAGSANGTARLHYAITVERETAKGLMSIAARLAGGVRDAVVRSGPTRNLTITYDRDLTAGPVLVDHVRIDVGKLEPGRYRVSLTVTDLTTSRSAARLQRFTIVGP